MKQPEFFTDRFVFDLFLDRQQAVPAKAIRVLLVYVRFFRIIECYAIALAFRYITHLTFKRLCTSRTIFRFMASHT